MATKEDVIAYRLKKVAIDLEAAHAALSAIENWTGAVNRLYYAAFHSVSALLHQHTITVNSHGGAKAMFELHFVKEGLVERKWSKFYTNLFESRNESDYEDFVILNADDVLPLLPQTAEFIELIKGLINKS